MRSLPCPALCPASPRRPRWAFHVDALGFDETFAYGGQALFVSAGGYHHHMAMNVWNSRGAGPRMPALGLGRVDLALPDADALGGLADRLRHHGVAVRDDGRTLRVRRPVGERDPRDPRLTLRRFVSALRASLKDRNAVLRRFVSALRASLNDRRTKRDETPLQVRPSRGR